MIRNTDKDHDGGFTLRFLFEQRSSGKNARFQLQGTNRLISNLTVSILEVVLPY